MVPITPLPCIPYSLPTRSSQRLKLVNPISPVNPISLASLTRPCKPINNQSQENPFGSLLCQAQEGPLRSRDYWNLTQQPKRPRVVREPYQIYPSTPMCSLKERSSGIRGRGLWVCRRVCGFLNTIISRRHRCHQAERDEFRC